MKKFVFLTCLLSSAVFGVTPQDSIHSVLRGEGAKPHMIRYNSGSIGYVQQGQETPEVLARLTNDESVYEKMLVDINPPAFAPTYITSGQANEVFQRMNPNYKRVSECSDRAHVWAYEEFKKSGLVSEKIFIFLTRSYIEKYNFKWWFHVAPMVTVVGGQKLVMDYRYKDRPVSVQEWKDMMVATKRDCVRDFKLSVFNSGADQTQDCFIKYEPMYYRLPGDVEGQEKGVFRSEWNEGEVGTSRSWAFNQGSI